MTAKLKHCNIPQQTKNKNNPKHAEPFQVLMNTSAIKRIFDHQDDLLALISLNCAVLESCLRRLFLKVTGTVW